MAITANLLGSLSSTGNAYPYDAAGDNAPSGAANTLLVAMFSVTGTSVQGTFAPTGHGVTWVEVPSSNFDRGTTIANRVWYALGSGATTTKFQLPTGGPGTPTGADISVVEFTDIDVSAGLGTNGAGKPIIQVVTVAVATSTTVTAALAAASHTDNRSVLAAEHGANETNTVGTNMTFLHNIAGHSAPTAAFGTEWSNAAFEQNPSMSWTTSVGRRAVGFELNRLQAAAATSMVFEPMMRRGTFPSLNVR